MKTNIDNFFKEENRSMMGGWTIEGRKKAIEDALKLDGMEKEKALLGIIDRLVSDEADGSDDDSSED